jgi:hypothetical protein
VITLVLCLFFDEVYVHNKLAMVVRNIRHLICIIYCNIVPNRSAMDLIRRKSILNKSGGHAAKEGNNYLLRFGMFRKDEVSHL